MPAPRQSGGGCSCIGGKVADEVDEKVDVSGGRWGGLTSTWFREMPQSSCPWGRFQGCNTAVRARVANHIWGVG